MAGSRICISIVLQYVTQVFYLTIMPFKDTIMMRWQSFIIELLVFTFHGWTVSWADHGVLSEVFVIWAALLTLDSLQTVDFLQQVFFAHDEEEIQNRTKLVDSLKTALRTQPMRWVTIIFNILIINLYKINYLESCIFILELKSSQY